MLYDTLIAVTLNERTVKQQDIIPLLRKEFAQIAGARVFAAPYPMVQGQRGEPLQFVLAGENLQEFGRLTRELQGKLALEPALGRIDRVLLSSEPYRFGPDHVAEAQALCPRARVQLVDGERLSWWGVRGAAGLDYLCQLAGDDPR